MTAAPVEEGELLALANRLEAASGPDPNLDADIAEQVYGWRPFRVGPDYDGQNACEVLTETGAAYPGFAYPPRGVIPRSYHVPPYTRDSRDSAFPRDAVRRLLAEELRARARAQSGEG